MRHSGGVVKGAAMSADLGYQDRGEEAARDATQLENLLNMQAEFISAIRDKLEGIISRAGSPVPAAEKSKVNSGWVSRFNDHNEELAVVNGMLDQLGMLV